jgi:short subunit dehydrogenase-like uncharacterized protein
VKRDFDLIVYGATGYTGRLIAEYLATSYRGDDAPSWAIAGRSTDKLQKVRADIGAADDLPLVKADAAEPASLRSMCERAAVILRRSGLTSSTVRSWWRPARPQAPPISICAANRLGCGA